MKILGLSVFITPHTTNNTVCLIDGEQKYIVSHDNVMKKVDKFPIMHYRVKTYAQVSEVFDFSKNYLNMDYFELKTRFPDIKRKVWIFKGDSLLGKTFLSDKIDLNKYETDSSPTLPELLTEDIIVLGNKYSFLLEDIIQRIYQKDQVDIVVVDFKNK